LNNPNIRSEGYIGGSNVEITVSISITPPWIRSYCHKCDQKEPYNFVNSTNTIHEFTNNHPTIQVFALAYECQGCKDVPEVFLIRREGTKLTLGGRSPIEEIILAPQIPKSNKKYISDATLVIKFESDFSRNIPVENLHRAIRPE
jgi:hypothetical protein